MFIFNDKEFILIKINYYEIIFLEVRSGKYVYFSRSDDKKFKVKGTLCAYSRYPELDKYINQLNFDKIHSFLLQNISEKPSKLFYLYMKTFFSLNLAINSDFSNQLIEIVESIEYKDFAFQYKVKPDELFSIILQGILFNISQYHLLEGIDNRNIVRGKSSTVFFEIIE